MSGDEILDELGLNEKNWTERYIEESVGMFLKLHAQFVLQFLQRSFLVPSKILWSFLYRFSSQCLFYISQVSVSSWFFSFLFGSYNKILDNIRAILIGLTTQFLASLFQNHHPFIVFSKFFWFSLYCWPISSISQTILFIEYPEI